MFICSIGQSQCENDLHYRVRVTLFTPLMSEKYLPGHIEAEILDVTQLRERKILSKDDQYYVNYWPSGNKKPAVNPSQKYKGVNSIILYLDESEIVNFIKSANHDAKKVTKSKSTLGNWKRGYNLFLNNCADAIVRAFNLKVEEGITIPTYVYNKLIKNKKVCCNLVMNK